MRHNSKNRPEPVDTAIGAARPANHIADVGFQNVFSDIAASLVGLSIDTVDEAVTAQLQALVEFLNADRGTITTFCETSPRIAHDYAAIARSEDAAGNCLAQLPWFAYRLQNGTKCQLWHLPGELPEEAVEERRYCQASGTRACIVLPMVHDRIVIGTLCLEFVTPPPPWPETLAPQLPRLADLFARILVWKKADTKVRELFRFEQVLSEISSMFANLPADEVDKHIGYGLERIGSFLKADRSNYTHGFKTETFVGRIYSWENEGVAPLPPFDDLETTFPWSKSRILYGKTIHFTRDDELPKEAAVDIETWRRIGTRSHVNVPIAIGGPIVGALSVSAVHAHRAWPKEIVTRLRLVGEVFANALVRKKKELEVTRAFVEIKALKSQIEADCTYLKEEIDLTYDHHHMIGQSEAFKAMIYKIDQIAAADTTVLITGETGTGKEMVARAIHANSQRKGRPMVKVNCASLSASLIESELFGHEKGSFTGSHGKRIGRFELANGNTLFLDEIGELPIESQAKLLRVLQEGEFERLGSSTTIKVDVRIIAATNRVLDEEVKKKRFRADLWYRLNIFPIEIPPLRRRKEDIPLLADGFTQKFSRKAGKAIEKIPLKVMKSLQHYRWPGNVRELENVIERAVINTQGGTLQLLDPLFSGGEETVPSGQQRTLAEIEKHHILKTLEDTRWRVEGPRGAARILGLHPSTLRSRMRKHGIR